MLTTFIIIIYLGSQQPSQGKYYNDSPLSVAISCSFGRQGWVCCPCLWTGATKTCFCRII